VCVCVCVCDIANAHVLRITCRDILFIISKYCEAFLIIRSRLALFSFIIVQKILKSANLLLCHAALSCRRCDSNDVMTERCD